MSRPNRPSGGLNRGPRGGSWAPNLTPRAAVRIATLGGIIVAMLGLLLVRLWFLQIISGEDYSARAQGNFLREVVVEAPRGNILAADGRVLVGNAPGKNIVAAPSELRGAQRERVLTRLARRLDEIDGVRVRPAALIEAMEAAESQGQPTAVLLENVPPPVVRYMAERWRDYRGVSLENTWVRTYPQGRLAAHILGTTGKIGEEDLREYRRRGYSGNETIGVGGLEQQYERVLRGVPGRSVYEIEASGEPRAQPPVSTEMPRQGNDVQTSIDIDVQDALEASLARRSEALGSGRGAAVVLDVRTGDVVAIASYPSFDPQVFVDRRDRAIERLYTDPRQPVFNRVVQGEYPVASTFKPITAVAALRTGLITPSTLLESSATVEFYDQTFQNFRFEQHGFISLPKAIEVSSDTYFFRIGDDFYRRDDSRLQEESRRFGFGSPTGVDLPAESAGLVPDPTWKKRRFAGPDFNEIDRIWRPGDTIQLTVGQGYFQATPLQLAQSYAALANGGIVHTPTIGNTVLEPNGRALRSVSEGATSRDLDLDDGWLASIRDGVFLASNGAEGTSTSVFGGLPDGAKVAGKTGTAETGQPAEGGGFTPDHSWFAGYAPADDPHYAIAVVVENAGTGSNAAAPVACETMTVVMDVDPEECGAASQAGPGN